MKNAEDIKKVGAKLNLLYIESSDKFRLGISKLLNEHFKNIYIASDDKNSIFLFKKYHPQIIIMDIDIDIYYFDWIKISKHIKEINPEIKIIILSTRDDTKNLLNAIDLGIIKFLVKPIENYQLSNAIKLVIKQHEHENNIKIFYTYLHSIFNNRKTMIMLIKGTEALLVNYVFLDFFDVENIDEFSEKYKDIGGLFLWHEDYLYTNARPDWLNEISENPEKQYNIQMKNKDEDIKHFLFKYHAILEKKDYAILSFDDITELNMGNIKYTKAGDNKEIFNDKNSILKSLKSLQKNEIKIHMYNYYKGLSIIHDAFIIDVTSDTIVLKTDYLQQMAVQIEGKTILSSELLPFAIACDKVSNISFEKRSIELQNMHFSRTSPTTRKTIRLIPNSKDSVNIFVNHKRITAEIKISDISLDSISLTFDNVPKQLHKNTELVINMKLSYKNKELNINNIEAIVVKEAKKEHNSSISFALNLDKQNKESMLDYISSRQIEIIKEFKALKK